jgi:NOL1/NOP2/fmu family ribosome biogenesis protein
MSKVDSKTFQACDSCISLATALEAEAGQCCIVGNLKAKLKAVEEKHEATFAMANEKVMEVVSLETRLADTQARATELGLKLSAHEDMVAIHWHEP